MSKHLIFIYGSLRRGSAQSMSKRFPESRFVAEAKVNGSLYDLGEYPGLIVGESKTAVIGEVYEVDDEVLKKLDDFEASSNYLRKQTEISLGGDRRIGWTYEPNPEFYSLRTLVTSGDWLKYVEKK